MKYKLTTKGLTALLFVALCAWCAQAETNVWREAVRRLHVNAYADVETAYWARGKIVNDEPYSAQFVDLSYDLDPFGRIGGYAWSVSAFSKGGQSASRRNAYNEVDYGAYYSYGWQIAKGWTLDSTVAPKWVTLPGYRPDASTICEWNFSQSLKNPYVTPYYLMRRAYSPSDWLYWDVGLTRSWTFLTDFTFTATFFGEFGDSRHFLAQYGANPNSADGHYSHGLMALNLMLRLDYAVTDWLGLFVFFHQFDVVSGDARDALDRSSAPEAHKDLPIGGVGVALKF